MRLCREWMVKVAHLTFAMNPPGAVRKAGSGGSGVDVVPVVAIEGGFDTFCLRR